MLLQLLEAAGRSELIATWRRTHEPDHPERVHLPEIGPRSPGARRCTNPACKYGGRWVCGRMVPNAERQLICVGCYVVYEPRDVIDPDSEHFPPYLRGGR
jgi:hypothetical protein